MDKLGKFILIGVVLIAIAVPLGFLIKSNFTQRLAKATKQGIDFGLKAKEAVDLSNQANQQIEQTIENMAEISTSTIIIYDKSSIFSVHYPDTWNIWKIKTEKLEELSFTLPEIISKNAFKDKGGDIRDSITGLSVNISITPTEYSNLEEYLNSKESPTNDEYFPTYI